MSLGVYISVPFCRSKCSYCNFASGVFSATQMARYVDRLSADITSFPELAAAHSAEVPRQVNSVYLGGGTPSLLPPLELTRLLAALAGSFDIAADAEITVECAPGTIHQPNIEALVSGGVNRVSLGVQSFVDREAASVARLHTRDQILKDIEHLRRAGITNINIDLIAGLPYQTPESWLYSLEQSLMTGVSHVSVYMLEVDADSRLGRELMAGGTKYHAHFVPDDDLTADFYELACSKLTSNGIFQYEISNFARPGFESRHNLKYWTRQPYLGFGVDAHSMLPASKALQKRGTESIRLATTDSLQEFLISRPSEVVAVGKKQALEESFFLGLRLNHGVDLNALNERFGSALSAYLPVMDELAFEGLLYRDGNAIQLTPRGRLLSNEVFARFVDVIQPEAVATRTDLPAR